MGKLVTFLVMIMAFRILPGQINRCFQVANFSLYFFVEHFFAVVWWRHNKYLVFRILPGRAWAVFQSWKLFMLIFRLALFFCGVMTSHQILVFKILPGPNRSIVRALFSKRTVCFIARLIKGLSSQYFEDICVLLIGGVCGKCPLNTTRTVLSCGQIAIRGQCVLYHDW